MHRRQRPFTDESATSPPPSQRNPIIAIAGLCRRRRKDQNKEIHLYQVVERSETRGACRNRRSIPFPILVAEYRGLCGSKVVPLAPKQQSHSTSTAPKEDMEGARWELVVRRDRVRYFQVLGRVIGMLIWWCTMGRSEGAQKKKKKRM
ncbi:hypothetical protein AAC387_Pa03g0891 [Persea americana]